MKERRSSWPTTDDGRGLYINRVTGKVYAPHHAEEHEAVFTDGPRFCLIRGGEGSGKTTAGAIKALERVRRGMNGVVVGPNFEHFKISTWRELSNWIPWEMVVDRHRYRENPDWEPLKRFYLNFKNGAWMLLGGVRKDGSWEGPNVSWWWFDEARHIPSESTLRMANGRVRIPGPNGEPPQIFLTSTPDMNWLHEVFGPITYNNQGTIDDPYLTYKRHLRDVVLLTVENEENLQRDFAAQRALGLSEVEEAVLLRGEWGSIERDEPFLENMILWENCRETLDDDWTNEPMIIAIDASKSRDSFSIVGVTQHPDRARWAKGRDVAVRYVRVWTGSEVGRGYDFPGGPEPTLRALIASHNVIKIVYDPYQLHDMMTRFMNEGLVKTEEFPQGQQRTIADSNLYDVIIRRGIGHNGDRMLYNHLNNAACKTNSEDRTRRITKDKARSNNDAAVALSMAVWALQNYPFISPLGYA